MDEAYRQQLFQIVNHPKFPGVERWKELLVPTSAFKTELVNRRLVGAVNRLYGWNLADNGQWTADQANDVMLEIVAQPGFSVDAALRSIAAGRKP
jgi:hypothetical protein